MAARLRLIFKSGGCGRGFELCGCLCNYYSPFSVSKFPAFESHYEHVDKQVLSGQRLSHCQISCVCFGRPLLLTTKFPNFNLFVGPCGSRASLSSLGFHFPGGPLNIWAQLPFWPGHLESV